MKLSKILANTKTLSTIGNLNKNIKNLTFDSKKASKNCIFFCISGTKVNAEQYISKAIDCGAVAVVATKSNVEYITKLWQIDSKKYAQNVTTLKKITPHKLRSTYGTNLYNETGDIYLVADVLGHKDVNTTKKHYAAQDQNHLRLAANAVKLRESK